MKDTEQKLIDLWDQFAMEFYKARVTESTYWQAPLLAAKSYEYASAMMREREARLLAMGNKID